MRDYLNLLEKWGVTPNFWCSQEYFEKANLKQQESLCYEGDGKSYQIVHPWVFIVDPNWGIMFPPIHEKEGLLNTPNKLFRQTKVWSDFLNYQLYSPEGNTCIPKFLDYEFIYNPSDFFKMEGGKWAVFRKNSRKFPKRLKTGWDYRRVEAYISKFGDTCYHDNLSRLMIVWLSSLEKIHDDDVLMRYIEDGHNRKVLYDQDGRIYGINIWDSNYHYVNFRFSICTKKEFANEFIRLLFYTDPEILKQNKLVNDGGTLGSTALYNFKKKLNPVRIREVRSWFIE